MSLNLDSLEALMDAADAAGSQTGVSEIPLNLIHRDPTQPRKTFSEDTLAELSASIKAQGIIQPILVRPMGDDDSYRIVAGERRWRAAQLAGLETIPVVVRELDESTTLAVQLVENLDREDVSILEEAMGVARLIEIGHKPGDVANILGKVPSWVSQRRKIAKGHELVTSFVEVDATRDPETLAMLIDLAHRDRHAYEGFLRRSSVQRAAVRTALDVAKGKRKPEETPAEPQKPRGAAESVGEGAPAGSGAKGKGGAGSSEGRAGGAPKSVSNEFLLRLQETERALKQRFRGAVSVVPRGTREGGVIHIEFDGLDELAALMEKLA